LIVAVTSPLIAAVPYLLVGGMNRPSALRVQFFSITEDFLVSCLLHALGNRTYCPDVFSDCSLFMLWLFGG